jgi:hypothetical protein
MSYFIFLKNLDNVEGTLYRVAENQSDLNNLNISQSCYKIIEDSQYNFNLIKYGDKIPLKYNNDVITYVDGQNLYKNKIELGVYLEYFKNIINNFLIYNQSHLLFNRWNNYYNQLNNLNLDSITYPLNKSLEQYFDDLGQPSYSILQIP